MSRQHPFTPLRYPGGKGAFAPYIKLIIDKNELKGCEYLEPFAGGAGVALDLLFNGYCSKIHINDYDVAIYNFWKAVTRYSDEFLALLRECPITIDEWHKQKEILDNPHGCSDLKHGFAAFFLNRTNRSGILKGGVIGGKSQSGAYKLDARFKKDKLCQRIKKIAQYAEQIEIYNYDALDLLDKIDFILPKKSLIYFDPPYYVKGQGLYRNFYEHDDHKKIMNCIKTVKQFWLISYDDCSEIRKLYNAYRQNDYVLNYCAYHKRKGAEVVIFDDKLIVPESN